MKYYTYKYKYQLAETLAVELHDKFPDAEAKWCSVKEDRKSTRLNSSHAT